MDLEAEKKFPLQRDQEWARLAFAARDIDRIVSFWTDDAVVLAPGLPPITGKTALREYVEGSFRIPGFKINWTSSTASISPDGKLAYLFGDNRHDGWSGGKVNDDRRTRGHHLAKRI